MKWQLAIIGLLLTAAVAPAQDFDAKIRDLVKKFGHGTDDDLRLRLIDLGDQDSVVRRYDMDRLSQAQQRMVLDQMAATDKYLTGQLREVVAEKGWPTMKMVGVQASEDAARVLLHSPDRDFQRRMTPQLEKLVEAGEILGTNVAPLIDQLRLEKGKPQRFGTQYTVKDGKAFVDPVEDVEHLDERRAAWFLPPMAQYKRELNALYQLQVQ
jgi:hypothetical protein